MIILVSHPPSIPPCMDALHAFQEAHITLAEFHTCIDTIERSIRLKKADRKDKAPAKSRGTGQI